MKRTKSDRQYERFAQLKDELCSEYHETIRHRLPFTQHLADIKAWRDRRGEEIAKLPRWMRSELDGVHHAMFYHIQIMEVRYVHIWEGKAYRSCTDHPALTYENFESDKVRSGHVWGNPENGTPIEQLKPWGDLLTESESRARSQAIINSSTC